MSDHPPVFPPEKHFRGAREPTWSGIILWIPINFENIFWNIKHLAADDSLCFKQKLADHQIPKEPFPFGIADIWTTRRTISHGHCHFLFRPSHTYDPSTQATDFAPGFKYSQNRFGPKQYTSHLFFSTGKFTKRWRGLTWCHEKCKWKAWDAYCNVRTCVCVCLHISWQWHKTCHNRTMIITICCTLYSIIKH